MILLSCLLSDPVLYIHLDHPQRERELSLPQLLGTPRMCLLPAYWTRRHVLQIEEAQMFFPFPLDFEWFGVIVRGRPRVELRVGTDLLTKVIVRGVVEESVDLDPSFSDVDRKGGKLGLEQFVNAILTSQLPEPWEEAFEHCSIFLFPSRRTFGRHHGTANISESVSGMTLDHRIGSSYRH